MPDEKSQGGQNSGGSGEEKIKIDDKEYSKDDLKNILVNANATAAKATEVSRILDAAKSYDLSPEEYVEQSQGAFSVVSSLMEAGVIDRNGRLIEKKENKSSDDDLDLSKFIKKDDKTVDLKGVDKTVLIVIQSLNEQVKALTEKIANNEEVQTSLVRDKFTSKLKGDYPDLDDDDISKVFAKAMNVKAQGKKVDIQGIAKEFSDKKQAERILLVKDWAVKHGINYEDLVKAKETADLDEKSKDPASIKILGGKKISFIKGENNITPKQATKTFFEKLTAR
jgi:hypothetical protein